MCGCSNVVMVDLTPIMLKLADLEALMATAAEQITALSAKTDAAVALVADVKADFDALLAAMAAERENLTPTGQAAIDAANARADALAARLGELDVAVGDNDGSDTPPPEPEPVP
jgi:hypothetical protein